MNPNQQIREMYAAAAATQLKARTSTLAQIEALEPNWITGGVHKEICMHLDGVITLVERGEKDPASSSGGPRLILQTPPGIGKTMMSGVHLISHAMGRHPEWDFIYATHGADLAEKVGEDTRNRINDPRFGEIHPKLELSKSSNAKNYFTSTHGGKATFIGVDGGALGRRAHCVARGELVATEYGPRAIEDINPGDRVWSWNHTLQKRELCAVRATQKTLSQPVVKVHGPGARIRVTDAHLLFTGICYSKASTLTVGDSLYVDPSLPTLPSPSSRSAPRSTTEVLWPCLPYSPPGTTLPAVPDLRDGTEQEAQAHPVLFLRLPMGEGQESPAYSGMPTMQDAVLRGPLQEPVLRQSMCRQRTQRPDVGVRQPELAGRPRGAEALGVLQEDSVASDDGARRDGVYPLRVGQTFSGSSHRRGSAQRRGGERHHSVRLLPHAISRLEPIPFEGRHADGYADVYDLQVDGNHNFFVNGILVHNCLIIDDPFKNEAEARSELHQEHVFKFVMSVAESRLHPYGAIVVIHQRWHVKDLIGRLLELKARPWTNCMYPMVAMEDCSWRKKGESVHKERFSAKWCELTRQTKIESGNEWIWSAMYQQQPTLDSGMLFKREWFKLIPREKFPKNLRWYISTDFGTSSRGDPSVSQPFAIDENDNIYFVDPYHAKVEPNIAHAATFDCYERHNASGIFVEKGGLWNTAQATYRQEQERRRVYPRTIAFNRTTNKGEHAQGLVAHMAAGKVFHVDSEFTREVVIPQFMSFTGERGVSDVDDIVDTQYLPFLSWREVRRPGPTVDLPVLEHTPALNQQIISGYGLPPKKTGGRMAWTAAADDSDGSEPESFL